MAEQGGYRAPANPAPVSGPGALSQRTDGQPAMQLPNPAYGEQQEFQAIQQGAPMMQEPGMAPPPSLLAPSDRPDEPVSAGAALGPGPGPESLRREEAMKDMSSIGTYMPMMERMAQRPDAPRSFRALVSYIKAFNGNS
jgi:hypothetical protein